MSRNSKIGASEIGAIMGYNPWQTPTDVWMVKTGRRPEFAGNEQTERGLLLESAVGNWFAKETGYTVTPLQVRMFFSKHCSATPDFSYEYNGVKGLLETKTTAMRISDDTVPLSWFLQAMFQAAIVGDSIDEVSIAWLGGDLNFGFNTYEIDQAFCRGLINFADEWYEKHVIGDTPPEPKNAKDLEGLVVPVQGKAIQAGDTLLEMVERAKYLRAQMSELEAEYLELKVGIQLIMRDAEILQHNGETLCTWKQGKDKTVFDAKALEEAEPEVYRKFVKVVKGNRTFLLK